MDYVSVNRSFIFTDVKKVTNFVKKLKKITNFSIFFDVDLDMDEIHDCEDDDCFWLELKHRKINSLSYLEITTLIKNIMKLSRKYKHEFQLTLKIMNSGEFQVYWIVVDTVINDVTDKMNDLIQTCESEYFSFE